MSFFLKKRPGGEAKKQDQGGGPNAPRASDHDTLADTVGRTTEEARNVYRRRQESVIQAQDLPQDRANTRLAPQTAPPVPAGEETGGNGKPGSVARQTQAAPEAQAAEAARLPFFRRILAKVRGFFLLIAGLLVFLASLLAVYKFSLLLYDWLHTSPMFITRHVDITGNVRLQRDMILHLGGIKEGDNSFSVSVSTVERRLRRTPWVEDVSVKRILPDRFVIRLQERMPSFWVRSEGRLFYANEKGQIIAPVESSNFMSLPILTIEPGCEDAIPYLSRLMRDIRSGTLPVEAGAIATVDVSASRGVELYLEDREMRLSLAPDDWDGNLQRLGMTIGDLARRRELSRVLEVRASRDSVWVVLRKPVEQQ